MSEAAAGLPNVRVVDHPLVADRLGLLRRRETSTALFRRVLDEISELIAYEATRDLPGAREEVATPVGSAEALAVDTGAVLTVPILRAGLAQLPAVLRLLPGAAVGFVGVVRDEETKEPREYLVKLPADRGGAVFVVDPMVATAGTAVHTLDVLNAHGIDDGRIRFIGLVAAPEGARALLERHPGVPLYLAALDSGLNAEKEIVPGVGDVGDRLFGVPAASRTA